MSLEQTRMVLSPLPVESSAVGEGAPQTAGKRRGASVKSLKKILKKAGLKTAGKKAALTRRVKKAGLKMKGGEDAPMAAPAEGARRGGEDVAMEGARRRRSRRNGLVQGVYRGVRGVTRGTLRTVGSVGRSVFGRARGGEDEMY